MSDAGGSGSGPGPGPAHTGAVGPGPAHTGAVGPGPAHTGAARAEHTTAAPPAQRDELIAAAVAPELIRVLIADDQALFRRG